jgi:hypothetical protein
MQWRDVVKSLGSQQGISTRGGRVVSLLCGSRYEDYIQEGNWFFRYWISASIHMHFQPMPHESASFSMG